jgi:hypothetical protein
MSWLRLLFPHAQAIAAEINRQIPEQRVGFSNGLNHLAFFAGAGTAQQRNRATVPARAVDFPANRAVLFGDFD